VIDDAKIARATWFSKLGFAERGAPAFVRNYGQPREQANDGGTMPDRRRTTEGLQRAWNRTAEGAGAAMQQAVDVNGLPKPPSLPLRERWGVSLGDLVAANADVPRAVASVLKRLDRLSAFSVSPTEIGFDGSSVDWSDVREIRTSLIADALAAEGLEREIDRLITALPPVPGRKWLVTRVMDVVAGLAMALQRTSNRDEGKHDEAPVRVPSVVVYRGQLRQKELKPGVVALLAMAAVPEAAQAVFSLGAQHGVVFVERPPSPASRKADSLLRALNRLEACAGSRRAPADEDETGGKSNERPG
jgi:hypothetical protein